MLIIIHRYQRQLPNFVDIVLRSNPDTQKLIYLLLNLLGDSVKLNKEPNDVTIISNESEQEYSIANCAQRIYCPTQIISGSEDRISGTLPVQHLYEAIKNCQHAKGMKPEVEYIDMQGGHLLPFEDIVAWRSTVIKFLS